MLKISDEHLSRVDIKYLQNKKDIFINESNEKETVEISILADKEHGDFVFDIFLKMFGVDFNRKKDDKVKLAKDAMKIVTQYIRKKTKETGWLIEKTDNGSISVTYQHKKR